VSFLFVIERNENIKQLYFKEFERYKNSDEYTEHKKDGFNRTDFFRARMDRSIEYVGRDLDYINYYYIFYKNPYMLKFILKHPKIFTYHRLLSVNPSAVDFLKDNPQYIDIKLLSKNTNNDAFDIIENNIDGIDWNNISKN